MINVRRNVLALGLVTIAMTFAGAAQAESLFTEGWMADTYVGLDITKTSIDLKNHNGVRYQNVYNGTLTGIGGYFGYRFTPMWSAELGYLSTSGKNKTVSTITTDSSAASITGNTKTEYNQWNFDVLGRYEVFDSMHMLGSVGMERSKLDVTKTALVTTANVKGAETDTSWRLGVGSSYAFTPELSGRVMVRYADTDFSERSSSVMYYSIGLSYDF